MATTDRFPLPREAWYIGAPSSRLAQAPLATILHGERIVLFRTARGVAHALQDRCPHRGVALSLGNVEDSHLACPYHGWRFDGAGACRHIPSLRQDQAMRPVALRSWPVVEQDGHVWLWTGAGAPVQGPDPIEDFAAHRWLQGSIDMACEAILPIENNLDICHAAFTHPHQHPQWFRVQASGLAPHDYRIETSAHGVTVTGHGTLLRYSLPDRVVVGGGQGFCLVLHHVPTTPGRCRQHWLLRRERVEAPVPPVWSDSEPEILAQDRRILESAQQAHEADPAGRERSVEADAPGLALRHLLGSLQLSRACRPHVRHVAVLS